MRTRKHKSHIAHILTLSLVWLILSASSDVALSAWQPPIGIPAPSFGIEETHMMYVGQTYDFGSGPEPYKDAGNGPYTHYVDNTHPNATDSGNPYGTASKPRRSIPSSSSVPLPEGSVVEIHNDLYVPGYSIFSGYATSARPIFIRGVVTGDFPYFPIKTFVEGTYIIVENIAMRAMDIRPNYVVSKDTHHVAVRNSEFYSTNMGPGGITAQGAYDLADGLRADDIVIYNNSNHDFGNLSS